MKYFPLFLAAALLGAGCDSAEKKAEERRKQEEARHERELAEARVMAEKKVAGEAKAKAEAEAKANPPKPLATEPDPDAMENTPPLPLPPEESRGPVVLEPSDADRLANARDAHAQRLREIATGRTTAIFFLALEDSGEWFETDRYGLVWRPNAAAHSAAWRPYADGLWVYTEYGWTWQSNEPFGWVVYHYGRWAKLPAAGWVWVPGHEWAPAWVAWRWHRPREAVGWAPLPPEAQNPKGLTPKVDAEYDIGPGSYVFVAINDFDAVNYVGKFLSPTRVRELLPFTQNVTSILPVSDGRMACGGPDASLINIELRLVRDKQEITPIAGVGLRFSNTPPSVAGPDPMIAGALTLFAPPLTRAAKEARPKKVFDKIEAGNVDRGWDLADPAENEQWRARVRNEAAAYAAAAATRPATPPPRLATPPPTARSTPRPRPVTPRPSNLNPGKLQPSSPLGTRQN